MNCIYHSRDLDGWMSAAIVRLWWEKNKPDNRLYLQGWDYGSSMPSIVEGERVVMVDISLPKEKMLELHRKNQLIWIDHHASAIADNTEVNMRKVIYEGKTDVKYAACELTWMFFFPDEQMPELVRLLGRYDCFGHKGTEEEQKVLEFQYGARANMFDVPTCYDVLQNWNSNLEHTIQVAGYQIYNYLCVDAHNDYKQAFPIYLSGHKILAINKQRFNPINFGIDYHKDGYEAFLCFWYSNGIWVFSLYNDDGNLDCAAVCKLHGGGGHKGAAGFTKKDLTLIINQ